jgi:hypothetical protein
MSWWPILWFVAVCVFFGLLAAALPLRGHDACKPENSRPAGRKRD